MGIKRKVFSGMFYVPLLDIIMRAIGMVGAIIGARILSPDVFSELKIDEKMLREIKTKLRYTIFDLGRLFCAKILFADKVEITDKDIDIIMQGAESFKKDKVPRPKRRAF